MDANELKRMLACKSSKKSSMNLCDTLATLARRLFTEFVDPLTIQPILASRLFPRDKGNGDVRQIGVGEVIRRIIGKCVTKVTKQDIIEPSGSLQVCVGFESRSEAAIHAMHNIFEADNTDAVLLIDSSNAFNSLNRAAALHNVRISCPTTTYAINFYREPARLVYHWGKGTEIRRRYNPGALPCYVSLRSKSSVINSTLECLYVRKAVLVRG